MIENEFNELGNKKCLTLSVKQQSKGILEAPHSACVDYVYDSTLLQIKVEQALVRNITISADTQISMRKLWEFYNDFIKLLMLFDGCFYSVKTIYFSGGSCSKQDCEAFAKECLSKRLAYYDTDDAFCYKEHVFINFDTVLTSELVEKWFQLKNELDIVHKVVLYSTATTGMPRDLKCAYFIECFEPLSEIIGLFDRFFPSIKPGDRNTTLKMCIDAVISKYGKDIFAEEYNKNKDGFLQLLKHSRVRIMHIKRNQPQEKYLNAEESILYSVKLFHLYRVVLLSILGIDYSKYSSKVIKSVRQWNSWNGVLSGLLNQI